MEPTTKLLQQIAFSTRPKLEKHLSAVMDKYTHEQNSCQPLQTYNKHNKLAVSFLIGYNGIFNVRDTNKNIIFLSAFEGAENKVIRKPPGA